jgi:outer membrane receptor for ferrienterochelin and colicins
VSVLSQDVVLTVKGLWYHNLWGFETIHGYGRAESQADDFRLEGLTTILLDDRNTLTSGIEANADAVGGDMFEARTIGGFALYAQDESQLATNLTATLGARYDYQSVGLTTPGGQLNPKLALSYIPTEGTTLRASFGMGYRVPSVAEAFITATVSNLVTIPNKDLRPEKSRSYEVGVNQRIWDFGLLDVAAFRTDYDDLIEAGLIVNGQDVQIQWRNITDARVQGLEASLKLGLRGALGSLQFSAGYTYVFPEDLTKHDVLKYRPRHICYGNLLGRIGDVSAGVDVRYLSRTDAVDVELVQVGIVPDGDERKEIIVADARLGMDVVALGAPLTATVLLNNVFQYNYVELIGNIMPPRTLILTLEARF